MRGDPLAFVEDLVGAGRKPHLHLGTHEAIRDAVAVGLDLGVIIEADAACATRQARKGSPVTA